MSPQDSGLVLRSRRRRQSGLSREEVAYLAGISADWFGRLEAGLDVSPSAATLLAIGNALRLEAAEIRQLFFLAGIYDPHHVETSESGVPPAIEGLIRADLPTGIVMWDAHLTPIAWNSIAGALFDISPERGVLQRNFVVRMADPYFETYFGADHFDMMRSVVGIFRRGYMTQPTPFAEEVYQLAKDYPLFRKFWEQQVVSDETTLSQGPHLRHHPAVGTFHVVTTDLAPLRRRDNLRLIAAADSDAAEKFKLLGRNRIAVGRSVELRGTVAGTECPAATARAWSVITRLHARRSVEPLHDPPQS